MGKRVGHSPAGQAPLQDSAYDHKEDPPEV